jgi:hypothetical protein
MSWASFAGTSAAAGSTYPGADHLALSGRDRRGWRGWAAADRRAIGAGPRARVEPDPGPPRPACPRSASRTGRCSAWSGSVWTPTLVTAHSEKQQASPTWKKGFGVHPLLGYCDNPYEPLAAMLRPRPTPTPCRVSYRVAVPVGEDRPLPVMSTNSAAAFAGWPVGGRCLRVPSARQRYPPRPPGPRREHRSCRNGVWC